MTSFGGNSNPFGAGGGGRYNNNSRGGGRNSRGGGRGRGRGRGRSSGRGGGRGNPEYGNAKFQLCKDYATKNGQCRHGNNCRNAHIVQRFGSIPVTSSKPHDNKGQGGYQNNNQSVYAANSVAIWNQGGNIKMFTASEDGFWRLWNTSGGNFAKEFESNMNGVVSVVKVVNDFLFCGFTAISSSLPEISVGMVHVWNLNNANAPPMELQHSPMIPYAHNQRVTAIEVTAPENQPQQPPTICSGSLDGNIRVWSFSGNQFQMIVDLPGHAREVSGLVYLPASKLLWSGGADGAIRIWDIEKKTCQHVITSAPTPNGGGNVGPGHNNSVTCLIPYQSSGGTFILSSSMDGTIRAWNSTNGECVANEQNGEGVLSMVITQDPKSNSVLLAGTESGAILLRNLMPTAKVPAFALLSAMTSHSIGHYRVPCKGLAAGPSATFYSVGGDGNLLVCQITGDLGLN